MSEEQLPHENSQADPGQNPQPESASQQPVPFPPPQAGFSPQGNPAGYGMQQSLPNSTLVLVFGIISIATCCCFYGILSLILSIVALVLSKKDRALYLTYPQQYTPGSYKNLNAGRVCAIIGLVLSIVIILTCIIVGSVIGWATLTDQQAMTEWIESMKNR